MKENFNYISFGNWDIVIENRGSLGMNRGRMFEYTPSDIAKRLEGLDGDAVSFMEKLPTFLCSEIKSARQGASMVIKYGRISSIRVEGREVVTTFEMAIDFGVVTFKDVEDAQSVFAIIQAQLYRTHWAVCEGDAKEVLNRLSPHKPNLADDVAEAVGNVIENVEPPKRDKKILGVAKGVKGVLNLLYKAPAKEATEIFFRGHSDATYELMPSLLRRWKNGDWKFLRNEDRLCKELLIAHYDEFQNDRFCFDRLVRMQHYGLPTRLLDISGNPLIALFFACSGDHKKPGEVIVFRVASDRVKYYDSDTVSCLSNLSNLSYEQKNSIDLKLGQIVFNETDVIGKLLHHIKSEKGYFEGRIIPDDVGSIVCVKAKRTNSRIKSQSGAFLLFGHEVVLPDAGQEGIEISRITIRNKKQILHELDKININATTVYPSIEQTAVHLREQYQLLSTDLTN